MGNSMPHPIVWFTEDDDLNGLINNLRTRTPCDYNDFPLRSRESRNNQVLEPEEEPSSCNRVGRYLGNSERKRFDLWRWCIGENLQRFVYEGVISFAAANHICFNTTILTQMAEAIVVNFDHPE